MNNQGKRLTDTRLVMIAAMGFGLLFGCGDQEPATPPVESIEGVQAEIYPGAAYRLNVPLSLGLNYETTGGAIYSDPGNDGYYFVAPLEPAEMTYRFFQPASGNEVSQGRLTVRELSDSPTELISEFSEDGFSARRGSVEASVVIDEILKATATFTSGDLTLVSTVDGDNGSITFDGLEIDGFGAKDTASLEALNTLSSGPLAEALSLMSLDLGCKEGADQVAPAAYAALLLPWQLILKYQVPERFEVIKLFVSESECGFPGSWVEPGDKPHHAAIHWSRDHRIPTTLFQFPWNGEGQLEVGQ